MRREHDVTVPPALALLDANDHPAAVDVGDLEADRLGGAQPSRIGRGQGGAGLEAGDGFQKTHNLVGAQHQGQLFRLAGVRDPLRQALPRRRLMDYAVKRKRGSIMHAYLK